MDLIIVLLVTATFPVAGLGFLLWMARFEDGLPDAVRRTARRPDPPPILAIPIQRSPVERAGIARREVTLSSPRSQVLPAEKSAVVEHTAKADASAEILDASPGMLDASARIL